MTTDTSQKLPAHRSVLSIRWIVTLAAAVLITTALLSMGYVSEHNARLALTREIQTRLLLQARNLALASSGALLGEFPELTLQPIVTEILARQPELAFAVVLDHEGVIQGHADARQLGQRLEPVAGLHDVEPAPAAGAGEVLQQNGELLVARATVRYTSHRAIGHALVALRRSYVDRMVAETRRQQALVLAVFTLLGILASGVLMTHLLRPLSALRGGLARIGAGDLDTPIRLRDNTELGLLAETVNEMAGTLKRNQVQLLERERLAHELDLARQLQNSLLPKRRVIAGEFLLEGNHQAAAEVGGDYFDILERCDGRVGIAVADVAGKGLGGCLVMSMLSALLRAYRDAFDSPAELLAALDERLGESLPTGTFVTMFYGVLDPGAGTMTFASAGHNPMLLYRCATRQVEVLGSAGIPLAAIRGGTIRQTLHNEIVTLARGDLLVEFTDGYSEALDSAGAEEFGVERMKGVVAEAAPNGADAVLKALRQGVRQWRSARLQHDDETLLVVSRGTAAVPAPVVRDTIGDDASRALDRLSEAERRGCSLQLEARRESLLSIREWIARTPPLSALDGPEAEWLRSALYEVCANVVEHGYHEDPTRSFELWWVPLRADVVPDRATSATPEEAARALRRGCFVVRDDGEPFRPDHWRASDFNNPSIRKRGRGIGLDIIHLVMDTAIYHPSTSRGNVTVLSFGPRPPTSGAEEAA